MKYPSFWYIVLGMTVGTFLIRSSFIYLSSKVSISKRARGILSLIPAAVFPALIVPMAFFHEGVNSVLYNKERFIVLVLATLICFKVKNILLTIVSGLLILYFLS